MPQDTPGDPTRNLGLATAEFMEMLGGMLKPGQSIGDVVIIGEIVWPNDRGGVNSSTAVHYSNRHPTVTGLMHDALAIVQRNSPA